MASDRLNFSTDTQNNQLSTLEPACMKNRQPLNQGAPKLSEEQVEEAKKQLINKSYINLEFPKVLRLRNDPPLAQQNYYLFTFRPAQGATPDKDGCFGVMKFRGAFPTPQEAEEWAEKIIRDVDSYNENLIGYVGREFPLTDSNKYCLTTKEVDVRTKLDTIARNSIKNQREQDKKEMEEIQERRRQLLADTTETKETSIDDLDYYIQIRVKRGNLRMIQEECEKKIKECGKLIKKTTAEISELDEKHPEYKEEYELRYKNSLESIGADKASESKMIKYMK